MKHILTTGTKSQCRHIASRNRTTHGSVDYHHGRTCFWSLAHLKVNECRVTHAVDTRNLPNNSQFACRSGKVLPAHSLPLSTASSQKMYSKGGIGLQLVVLDSRLPSQFPMSTVMCCPTSITGLIALVFKNCSDKTSLTVALLTSLSPSRQSLPKTDRTPMWT